MVSSIVITVFIMHHNAPNNAPVKRIDFQNGGLMIRKATAVWRGTGRAGSGHLSTDSGVLAQTPYSFKTRFENEKGTNPEELIAAAHAGCFTMALAFVLQAGGFTPTELSTEAAVTLEPEGQGFPHQPLRADLARPGAEPRRKQIP
jgi:OsmC subfamily peroxiredoxin